MKIFELKGNSDSSYEISVDCHSFKSGPVDFDVKGISRLELSLHADSKKGSVVGGMKGVISESSCLISGLEITRETFLADCGSSAGIRFRMVNKGKTRIHLNGIRLANSAGRDMLIGGVEAGDWKVLRFPTAKSDIPSYVCPGIVDKDFADAAFSCIKAVPGQGVVYNTVNMDTRTISSGPLMLLRNNLDPAGSVLMISSLGLDKHFFDMRLTTTYDRRALESFEIDCGFDGMAIDSGESAETSWLIFSCGESETELISSFTEMVAAEHGVKRPAKPSLTVFCTWYFYTFNFNSTHLDEELATIRAKNIPLDVFQIDDGWMDSYGNYEASPDKFPGGMGNVARKISDAGMIPGIWVAPFVIDENSAVLAKYSDIIQKDADGRPAIYDTSTNNCYIIDPTAPRAGDFLREIFLKLKSWGFRYFKLDWLRCLYEFKEVRFHNPKINRVVAYHSALKTIRDALGPECFMLTCGGLSDPAGVNLIDGVRTSKDVRGIWDGPEGVPMSGALIQIKQNMFRSYSNRFFHTDPDATQIRLRNRPFFENERKCVGVYQSEGHYTDEEAFSICTHQYLCGGMITISERFPELQEERLAMLRHLSPAITQPARILDIGNPVCPSLFLVEVKPKCESLDSWWTLGIGNWENQPVTRRIVLSAVLKNSDKGRFAVFEFRTQEFLGIKSLEEQVEVEIPPHGMRLLRIAPWEGKPMLLGTDLHFSGGGCEIEELKSTENSISGRISTKWEYPIKVSGIFPVKTGVATASVSVPAGSEDFNINLKMR